MNPNLGAAVLRTRLDASGLRTGLSQAKKQVQAFTQRAGRDFDQLGRKLRGVGKRLTIGVTTPILAMGGAFVKAASDAEETTSKFRTVFRDVGDEAERTADRLADSFGLSSTNARRLLGDTGDLLTGFGFTAEAALDLSTEVNELAVDLASFTNYQGGAEGASAALTKALLGQAESAKSLGIVIRQDLVEAKIEELRANGELLDATDQQAKAYATLAIAQEQSKNAIGDFARTADSFANQFRQLRSGVNDLAVEFGEVLLPIATQAVTALGNVVDAIAGLPDGVQVAIVAFGALAAAAGPLLIALGSIVSIAPKVVAGLRAIRTAALLAAGPAGWAAAGAIAIGGLALSMASTGPGDRNSLEGAANAAATAMAGGSRDTLAGALDELASRVDGPARDSLTRLREDLIQTGDVSVEQAQRILTAMASAQANEILNENEAILRRLGVSFNPAEAALQQAGAAVFGDDRIRDADTRVREALAAEDLPTALEISAAVYDLLSSRAAPSGAIDALGEFVAELRTSSELIANAAPAAPGTVVDTGTRTGAASTAGGASSTGGAAGGSVSALEERTVRTVFDELSERGAALVRIADFEGTPDAEIESARRRVRLIDSAIKELLTDFADTVGDDELEYLRRRRATLERQIRIATRDTTPDPGRQQGGGSAGTLALEDAAARGITTPDAGASLTRAESEYRSQGERIVREALFAVADGMEAGAIAAAEERERELEIAGLEAASRLARAQDPNVRARLSAQQGPERPFSQDEIDAANAAATAANERAEADRKAKEETERLIEAFRRVNAIESDPNLANRLAAQQGGGLPFEEPGEDFGDDVEGAGDDFYGDVLDAGQRLKLDLADAAATFTVGILQAIQSGDFIGAISSAFQAASSVTGALSNFGPAAGILSSGTAGILGLVSAGLPILGGLISGIAGLFGGGRDREAEEARAAESRRANRTPSFVVRVNVSQTNIYDSTNVDPRVRADNDRRTRAIVADVLREIDYAGLRRAALGSPL